MKMKKLDDPTIRDHWTISIFHFHFHFIFPHQIRDPNTALGSYKNLRQSELRDYWFKMIIFCSGGGGRMLLKNLTCIDDLVCFVSLCMLALLWVSHFTFKFACGKDLRGSLQVVSSWVTSLD